MLREKGRICVMRDGKFVMKYGDRSRIMDDERLGIEVGIGIGI